AFRAIGIEAGEAYPASGQLIEDWRPDVLAAVTAEVAVAQVVGEQEDDVGPAGRLGVVKRHGPGEQAREEDCDGSSHGGSLRISARARRAGKGGPCRRGGLG